MGQTRRGRRIKRIAVAVAGAHPRPQLLEAITALAAESAAELSGVFLEDEDLLRLAELPFAQEISRVTSTARPLHAAALQRELRVQAASAERLLAGTAERLGVAWSFRIARGRIVAELRASSEEADLLLVSAGRQPLGEGRGLSRHGPPARAAQSERIVVAFDRSASGRRALATAGRLAAERRAALIVLCFAGTGPAAQRLQARARELLGRQPARFEPLVRGGVPRRARGGPAAGGGAAGPRRGQGRARPREPRRARPRGPLPRADGALRAAGAAVAAGVEIPAVPRDPARAQPASLTDAPSAGVEMPRKTSRANGRARSRARQCVDHPGRAQRRIAGRSATAAVNRSPACSGWDWRALERPRIVRLPRRTRYLRQAVMGTMAEVDKRIEGSTAIVTFTNPPQGFLTTAMIGQLGEVLSELEADDEVRAIVFTGGLENVFIRHFSVEEIIAMTDALQQRRARGLPDPRFVRTSLRRVWEQIDQCQKPTIAAINGTCGGGGCELALCCDIRLAGPGDYRIGQMEIRVGLLPGAGGTARLARVVGFARALEWTLRGRTFGPREAAAEGLVNHYCEGDVLAAALELAAELEDKPPAALAYIKQALRTAADNGIAAGVTEEGDLFARLVAEDARSLEMMKAYVDSGHRLEDL